ncbi:MAG: DUF1800 domain-containing protein [Pirellulaceae bacterium]|jgi:uncharacterized protein (DUF1800 family)|nr:hypothetical protein [Planctomycetota bacterium]MDP6721220.1 DUF1800 domain-containing protein [Pirellulaceae bacterium]
MRRTTIQLRQAAIVLAAVATVGLAVVPSTRSEETGGLQPLNEQQWNEAKARHLLFRAGFGNTPEEMARLHALDPRQAVDLMVDFHKQPEPKFALTIESPRPRKLVIDRAALAKLKPEERKKRLQELRKQQGDSRRNEREQFVDLREWWIRRMVESPRQLEEKLVLFWHGHFATGYRTVQSSYAMYTQNELFRKHAAGNFGQMLKGIVHDPAMLRYLDNDKNVKQHPNENLAREIMELFSLGEGNYTEQDIKGAAHALTGYGFDRRSFEFVFRANAHDEDEKTIFGRTGNWDGDDLVDLILEQPATARFIARKLFVFFVHEDPSQQTVEQLAAVLRENDYELAPMLKTLFLSQEFFAPAAMGTQIKSPVQLVVGALRSLNIKEANCTALLAATQEMGQELLQPPNVKGWDGGRAWINTNTLFSRHNFAAPLVTPATKPAGQRIPAAADVDLAMLLEDKDLQSAADIVDYLTEACLVTTISDARRQLLIELLEGDQPLPAPSEWKDQRQMVNARLVALLVAIMGMPEYQLT